MRNFELLVVIAPLQLGRPQVCSLIAMLMRNRMAEVMGVSPDKVGVKQPLPKALAL